MTNSETSRHLLERGGGWGDDFWHGTNTALNSPQVGTYLLPIYIRPTQPWGVMAWKQGLSPLCPFSLADFAISLIQSPYGRGHIYS